ncbi:MAG TPA: DUF167 domain-containing protein [Candidatus Binatia bacterium]|nr:DUF167 domain-containing protein [Candidatus Binatia bacterium]
MRLQVTVAPKSRTEEIVASRAEKTVRIRVTAAPEDGRANRAVLDLLRERLGLPRGAVRIAGGEASRRKWIEIDGMDEEEVWRRLEAPS